MRANPFAVGAVLGLFTIFSHATEVSLRVGQRAPKLQGASWVQGEPLTEFERGKVYLVEFWATWCGPCRSSIPHLNELHQKYKERGLIVIGQDVWEREASAVAPFIKSMGEKMTYRVVLDTEDGKMAETWMEAAGQNGIPTAFLVDQAGAIAWIGHPMQLKESLLEEALAGTFDINKARAVAAAQEKTEQERRDLWEAFRRQRAAEEWDQAAASLDAFERLLTEEEKNSAGLDMSRLGLLLDRGDGPRGRALAEKIGDANAKDAMLQNQIAWAMVTHEDSDKENFSVAEKIARRALAATEAKDEQAEILDTLARAVFLKGEQSAAVDFEKRALSLAEGGRKELFSKTLVAYQAGELPAEARVTSIRRRLSRAMAKKEWDQAETALAEMEQLLPEKERAQWQGQRWQILLGRKDHQALTRLLDTVPPEQAMLLNQFSWDLVLKDKLSPEELKLAAYAAQRANDLTKGQNAEILDTYARVKFLQGHADNAIELQKQAVGFASGRRQKQFQKTLDSYVAGRSPDPY